MELISVDYSFEGSKAKIVATKVLGDVNVPAGEVTWEVEARAAQANENLNQMRQIFLCSVDLRDAELVQLLGVQGFSSDFIPPAFFEETREEMITVCPNLQAVHRGFGRIAQQGFKEPDWMPGELWVFPNGQQGFVWIQNDQPGQHYEFYVHFRPAEPDIFHQPAS